MTNINNMLDEFNDMNLKIKFTILLWLYNAPQNLSVKTFSVMKEMYCCQ